eukprot:scaffold12846_cov119-Isochrysis_galbana.AAC.1
MAQQPRAQRGGKAPALSCTHGGSAVTRWHREQLRPRRSSLLPPLYGPSFKAPSTPSFLVCVSSVSIIRSSVNAFTVKYGAPQGSASKSGAPRGSASKSGTPRGSASKSGVPRGSASKSGAPRGSASKSGAPRGSASKSGAPRGSASKSGVPRGTASKSGAPRKVRLLKIFCGHVHCELWRTMRQKAARSACVSRLVMPQSSSTGTGPISGSEITSRLPGCGSQLKMPVYRRGRAGGVGGKGSRAACTWTRVGAKGV